MQFRMLLFTTLLSVSSYAFANSVQLCNDTFEPVYIAELVVDVNQNYAELTPWSNSLAPGTCNNDFTVSTKTDNAYLIAMTDDGYQTSEAYYGNKFGCITDTVFPNAAKITPLPKNIDEELSCPSGHKRVRFMAVSTESTSDNHRWRIQIFVDQDIRLQVFPRQLTDTKISLLT